MLMKLIVNVFERARSKFTVTHTNDRISSDSDTEVTSFDLKSNKHVSPSGSLYIRQQPRSSLSKWLCTTPTSVNKSISSSSRSNKVRRSSSWRSLKDRTNNSISSRTYSVDELHRTNKQSQKIKQNDSFHSPIIDIMQCRQKLSNTRFDRLSSTLVNYAETTNKKSHRRTIRKQNDQHKFSTLSHYSGGGDSGYSEESFATRSFQRPLHTSCPHCHCERRSSFNNYKKLRNNSSTESSPSDIIINNEMKKLSNDNKNSSSKDNLLSSQSYSHIKPLPKTNIQSQRTLAEKRRRNLSCDGLLWTRVQTQKPITKTSSPVLSEPNRHPLQRHFTTIGMTHTPTATTSPQANTNIFGELNLAAIELDSLRTSLSSSSYSSSSSSSINNDNNNNPNEKRTFLVWHEYTNSSLLSTTNGTKIFSVKRGDQVRLLKQIGKSTLLVQKQEDGLIGFLPQTCLAQHQINSFLSLKGLRETVL
ncbi:unnamed protein product [Adineta steineri]|uniref:SH3 domain-containing protein n=1 Tax=Adineta steineri TaxID=433720 RepID=A0A814INF9_9BILA|nr:unnamed protein product [Adineta steineri]CAF3704268.1 unnamed protein product [Adineta steineri]